MVHARGRAARTGRSARISSIRPINVYERWRSREDLLTYRSGGGPEPSGDVPVTGADVELLYISASEAP